MARRVWIQIHHQESQLSSANDKVFGIICSLTGLPQKFRSLLAAVIFDPPGGPESFKPGVQLAHSQSIYHSVRAGARRNRRAAVPHSRGSPISTPPHGADGADALQGIGQQMPHRFRSRPEGSAVSRSRYSGNRLPLVNGTHLAARAAVWRTSTGLKAQGFVHLDVTFSFQSCPTDWDR